MKKVLLLVSIGAILGCSGKPQNAVSKASVLPVVQASSAPHSPLPTAEPVRALPTVSVGSSHRGWHSENVKDVFGNAVVLKQTSLDGKFDLVILQRGSRAFLSFAKHAKWESVYPRAAKGTLISLRLEFEDGQQRCVVWDELGFGTNDVYSVLWSFPVTTDFPDGPIVSFNSDSVGGDELLIQELMRHTAMLLEVAPGVTTEFDIAGLPLDTQKVRAPTEPILGAMHTEAE